MNSIEALRPSFNEMPSDIWNNVFGYLSDKRVFLIFPQINSFSLDLVKKFRPIYEKTDNYWKKLCLEHKHESWNGLTLGYIDKGPFFSWKALYLNTQPYHYLHKKVKYEKQIIELEKIKKTTRQSNVREAKTRTKSLFRISSKKITENKRKNELKAICNDRISFLSHKLEILENETCVDKLIVTIIGKERFNLIPLFKDCLDERGLVTKNTSKELNKLMHFYGDLTFPPIVRGETTLGYKYLFLRPYCMAKTNQLIAIFHTYIFCGNKESHVIKILQTRDEIRKPIVDFGISDSTINFLENVVFSGSLNWPKTIKILLKHSPRDYSRNNQ
jgi:hypothetical protein